MIPEELLKPRYKTLCNYPDSPLRVGQIITGNTFNITGGTKFHCKDYPAIFKPLAWWEDRDDKDMPLYIKYGEGAVYKITGWNIEKGYALCERGEDYPLWIQHHVMPVTEAEYTQYLNQ